MGFIFNVSSNNRTWYMIGAFLLTLIGIGVAIGGFSGWGTGLGVTGVVVAIVGLIFFLDALSS